MHSDSAKTPIVIVGAGMAGLATGAALARCAPGQWDITIYEQTPSFDPIGAGLQLGPNAAKVLYALGLRAALEAVACQPQRLVVRDGLSHRLLAQLRYQENFVQRYGAPNYTVHRADLHALLLQAALQAGCRVICDHPLTAPALEALRREHPQTVIVGCDGVHSIVRPWLLASKGYAAKACEPARLTGHTAWRSLLPIEAVPPSLAWDQTTAWLLPKAHGVGYPVRSGTLYNFVWITEGTTPPSAASLPIGVQDHAFTPWPLRARPAPAQGDDVADRAVLLGDAAHPMPPYLAQGAAMALEDAWQLACSLARAGNENPQGGLIDYVHHRAKRNERVVRRSVRNGSLFHAQGPLRWARNGAMRLLGERVIDVPWLYGYAGPPSPFPS